MMTGLSVTQRRRIHSDKGTLRQKKVQLNFNGSNTFGTMKIISRQGQFELIGVYKSARSGGIIKLPLIFYNMKVCCVFSLESPQREAILMSTHNIPFSI